MAYITFKDYPRKKYKCSVRLLRICADNRIYRLADFSKMTFCEVTSLPECGPVTAMQVKRILNDNGLDFRNKHNLRKTKKLPGCQQHIMAN